MMLRVVIFAMVLALLVLVVAVSLDSKPKSVPTPTVLVSSESPDQNAEILLNRTPLPKPLISPRLVIHKRDRLLSVYSETEEIRTFPIGLGPRPYGPKRHEHDGRTPEGSYYVCSKNPNSKYYLALGISYPNAEDAALGLQNRLISRRQYEQIIQAIASQSCPPWDTALGGAIVIHGRGASADWTLGCVGLEDGDMRVLFDAIPVGTPIIIEP